jgi:murein DD-endopeptidase MepM/ murein hydrolase activator NlpD
MRVIHLVSRLVGVLLPVVAAATPAVAGSASAALLLPVTPACISSPFGPRVLPGRPLAGTYHFGIDLPAPEGAPVYSTAPGEVIRVQRHGPGGLEMLVQHPGFIAVYSHLGHVSPIIADGSRAVFGGEEIGVVGRTGVTYGMHLYFGMFVNGRPVDPALYLPVTACGIYGHPHPPMLASDQRRPPSRIYFGEGQIQEPRIASR